MNRGREKYCKWDKSDKARIFCETELSENSKEDMLLTVQMSCGTS
jgi:hypothetical protein